VIKAAVLALIKQGGSGAPLQCLGSFGNVVSAYVIKAATDGELETVEVLIKEGGSNALITTSVAFAGFASFDGLVAGSAMDGELGTLEARERSSSAACSGMACHAIACI
jgi:hypothetical protein